MTDSALVIRVQHIVNDVLHRADVANGDRFALRMSEAAATFLTEGLPPADAVKRAIGQTRTMLFRNTSLTRARLVVAVTEELERLGLPRTASTLQEILSEFAVYAGSQLVRSSKSGSLRQGLGEEFWRSQLQTWLQRYGDSSRESHEGAGQSDLVFRFKGSGEPHLIEVKVPAAPTEFTDGLTEAAQYAQTMGLDTAHYLVIDKCADLNSPRYLAEPVEERTVDGIKVVCVRVLVPEVPPSKVGRARRRERRA